MHSYYFRPAIVFDGKHMYTPRWLEGTYFCGGHRSSIRVLRAQALDSVDEILEAHLVLDIDYKEKAREQGKEKARRKRKEEKEGRGTYTYLRWPI